jgi:hypothetical protein
VGPSQDWPALPYEEWRATCDTLHAHTQVLGKLSVALAAPEWQLAHAGLRLTARGWETQLLRSPDGSGGFVAALDLHAHQAVIEHLDGRARRVALTPDRPVGVVTRELLAAVADLAGPVAINPTPQEVSWKVRLDEDTEHTTYDTAAVRRYLAAAGRAALVLAAARAPFRGRSTPVIAWWGTFDLAVSFYNGRPMVPRSEDFITRNSDNDEHIALGWWPGDARHPRPAFYAYASPAPADFAAGSLSPSAAYWDETLGEFVLDWDDVIGAEDPHAFALEFCRTAVAHSCDLCGWDRGLAQSAQGAPPPLD